MIKLYILYFIFGFYMFFESFSIWTVSFFGVSIITYLALISSVLLLSIASVLSLYHFRLAIIIGLASLIGVFPFGIYWLIYRYTVEGPILEGTLNQIVLLATILYVVELFYSIKYIIYYKQPANVIILKRPLKLFLTFLPTFLLLTLIIFYFVNP